MKRRTMILLLLAAVVLGGAAWLYTPDIARASIESRYGVAPGDYVAAAGVRLHVVQSGPATAPTVILLHGFGSSLYTWDGWAAALSRQYRVSRLELPGFALTGPDPTGDYSDARSLRVLAALMDALQLPQAALIGHSLGGKLAWMFAAAYPQRVAKLVLIAPDGFASPGFAYDKPAEVPALVRALPYVLPSWLLRQSLLPAYGDPAALTDAVLARYRDMMLVPGVRQAIVARMAQVRLQPPEPLLKQIAAPTLLVWGERDAMIPFANAQDYTKVLAGSRVVSFADLGHVAMEEAPARTLAPVLDFLAQ